MQEYGVFMESGNGTRHLLISYDNINDAVDFCNMYHWEWLDENNFLWKLMIDDAKWTDYHNMR